MPGKSPRRNPLNSDKAIATITSIATTELIAAPGAGFHIKVLSISIVATAANTVLLKSGATSISPTWEWGASGGGVGLQTLEDGWLECAENEALNLTTTTTARVSVICRYQIVRGA